MSKLDEIRRDVATCREQAASGATEQMADTLLDHVAWLLDDIELWKAIGGLAQQRADEAEARAVRLAKVLETIRETVKHVMATDEPDATPDVLAILEVCMGAEWLEQGGPS